MADRPESSVSRGVADCWRKLGGVVIRVQSGKVPVRGGWMQLADKGTPDLLVLGDNGRGFWAETKTDKGKLTTEQLAMHHELRRRGHPVYVVRSEDDAREAWKAEMG